jgi:glycosidase
MESKTTNTFLAPTWVREAIFYQIFPERFCNGDPTNDPPDVQAWGGKPESGNFFGGDLRGILEKLPYLADFGINALYLTPIFQARTNHKYDTCDYFQVDPAFGDIRLLRQMIDEAHRLKIRVVLDAVFNHCGNGFWAFEDVLQRGQGSLYADWFFIKGETVVRNPPNYQTCGGAEYLPKLNIANPEVQDHLLQAAVYWIEECKIDGWRLDVPWKIPIDFWRKFRTVVKKANPEAYIVGEAWRDPQPWLLGDTCDALMNYPLRDVILDYCVRDTMDGEDFAYFSRRLLDTYASSAPFQLNLLGSHDTPRLLTICQGDIDRLALAVTAQFTLPGVPMVYYGDEVGLEGENDPGCRACMPWDPSQWNSRIHLLYSQLIQSRHEHPALRSSSIEFLTVFNGVCAFLRRKDQDCAMIILNPRQEQPVLRIPLSSPGLPNTWRDLFSGQTYCGEAGELVLRNLKAKSALILLPRYME